MGSPYRQSSPPGSHWQDGFCMDHFKQGKQEDWMMVLFKREFKNDLTLTSPPVAEIQEERHFSVG